MNLYNHIKFQLKGLLTGKQKSLFDTYGMLHFKNFMSRETVQSLGSELDKNEAGDLAIYDRNLSNRKGQSVLRQEQTERRNLKAPHFAGQNRTKQSRTREPFYHKLAQIKIFSLSNTHTSVYID